MCFQVRLPLRAWTYSEFLNVFGEFPHSLGLRGKPLTKTRRARNIDEAQNSSKMFVDWRGLPCGTDLDKWCSFENHSYPPHMQGSGATLKVNGVLKFVVELQVC